MNAGHDRRYRRGRPSRRSSLSASVLSLAGGLAGTAGSTGKLLLRQLDFVLLRGLCRRRRTFLLRCFALLLRAHGHLHLFAMLIGALGDVTNRWSRGYGEGTTIGLICSIVTLLAPAAARQPIPSLMRPMVPFGSH